jgi:hypothetical protein
MGKKGESYTHKWICYVRGVNNEDLSYLIEKVVFNLHSSFTNPVRCTRFIRQKFIGRLTRFRKSDGDSSKFSLESSSNIPTCPQSKYHTCSKYPIYHSAPPYAFNRFPAI